MSYVTLDKAKQHLHVLHDADDDYIQDCIDAAESYASSFMNRPSIEGEQLKPWDLSKSEIDSNDEVPVAVERAILLLVGEYYENRSQGVVGSIYVKLPVAESLLHFHRVNLGV